MDQQHYQQQCQQHNQLHQPEREFAASSADRDLSSRLPTWLAVVRSALFTATFAFTFTALMPSLANAQASIAFGVQQVSAGSAHSCAITEQGGVKCWGSNSFGQLGDGGTASHSIQADVSGLASGVAALALGGVHSCALTTSGSVKCWGSNSSGQLGDGSNAQQNTPVNVSGLTSGVVAIAAGGSFTCAVTATGGVKCWGFNSSGQLGDNTTTNRNAPVDVIGLASGVATIALGSDHSCALTKTGGVKCWGLNNSGQLGDNTLVQRNTGVDVSGLNVGVAALAAGGSHTCAVTGSGGVKCWGDNTSGDVGDNTAAQRSAPVDVTGLSSGVAAIALGSFHSCALTTAGGVKCWGMNSAGQIGDASTNQRNSPADVIGFNIKVATLTAGNNHTCAVTSGGSLKCWGSNSSGQLGDNTLVNRATLIGVNGLSFDVAAMGLGWSTTCAVDTGAGLKCWGRNDYGQIGDGTRGESLYRIKPVGVVGLSVGAVAVKGGEFHTCSLTTSGGVKCWGSDNYGYLGDGTFNDSFVPVDVVGLTSGAMAVVNGRFHSCALTMGGGVKCWGDNFYGQLGNNTTTYTNLAVNVVGLSTGVIAIGGGDYHSCALLAGGTVKCWGSNSNGELGVAGGVDSLIPVTVTGLSAGVTAIAVSGGHACALTALGGVKCWGSGGSGALGDGDATGGGHAAPLDVVGLTSGVIAIAAGTANTCAVTTAGALKCWGFNVEGELGDNTIVTRNVPTDVVGLNAGVADVAIGKSHTCARLIGGGLKCWGENALGEIGDNTSTQDDINANNQLSEQRNKPVYAFGYATRPVLTSSANPAPPNQTIIYTVTVSGNNPTGTVAFKANGVTLSGCSALAIVNGVASCATPFATIGPRIITVTYSGDNYNASSLGALAAGQVVTAAALIRNVGIDIDGNGKSQLIVRSASAQTQAGRLVANQFQFTALPDPGASFRMIGVGDFDNNGKHDLAYQDITQGEFGDVSVWPDFAGTGAQFSRKVKLAWIVQAVADLDGDGFDDMVFRFTGDDGIPNDTGVSYIWFMNGSAVNQVRKRGGAPLNWTLVGAIDINNDGAADMVYISPGNQIRVLMATPARTCANLSAGNLAGGYQALKVADFTGTGRGDILARNAASGAAFLLNLDATLATLPAPTANPDDPNASCTATSQVVTTTTILLPTVDPTWQFYASGDFNGDGYFDIVWKQPNGTLTLWLMNANGVPTVINNAGTAPAGFIAVQP